MSQDVCLRYTGESTPDLGGRQDVCGTCEKYRYMFTTQAPHTRNTEVAQRLLESLVLVFMVKTEPLAGFFRSILPDTHGC